MIDDLIDVAGTTVHIAAIHVAAMHVAAVHIAKISTVSSGDVVATAAVATTVSETKPTAASTIAIAAAVCRGWSDWSQDWMSGVHWRQRMRVKIPAAPLKDNINKAAVSGSEI